MFKRNRKVKGTASVEQLFYCCEEDLGDSIMVIQMLSQALKQT